MSLIPDGLELPGVSEGIAALATGLIKREASNLEVYVQHEADDDSCRLYLTTLIGPAKFDFSAARARYEEYRNYPLGLHLDFQTWLCREHGFSTLPITVIEPL